MPVLALNLSQADIDRPQLPGRRQGEATPASSDGGGGGAASTFWKVVATVATLILCWIGTQLIVVPTHSVQLQRLEANDQKQDARLTELERAQAAEKSGRDELIRLLKAEQADRQKRRR